MPAYFGEKSPKSEYWAKRYNQRTQHTQGATGARTLKMAASKDSHILERGNYEGFRRTVRLKIGYQ